MNLCAGLKEGIEVAIHTVREREELRRGETGEEKRERLKMEDQARMRQELARKRETSKIGRTMVMIPEER